MHSLIGILPWVLPPLLGAIIGYVTNAVAIRMLFRPLTEKRIFGLRIPLTPGLIPRERGDLAESMARMVSTELLTEEAVRNQIRVPSFQASVESSISSVTADLLDSRLRRFSDALAPHSDEEAGEGLLSSFGGLLSSAFSGFTRSESFRALLKELVRHLSSELAAKPVGSVLGGNRTLDGILGGLISGLNSERGREEIRTRVSEWVRRQFESNIPLETLITQEDVESVTRFVDGVYPSLIKFLLRWLRSEGTRRELIIRGRFLVQDIVDRLSGIQRLIITAAQYQRTLDENMEGIINDALTSIEEAGNDPESRRKLVEAIGRELEAIRRKGLADVAKRQEESVERAAGAIAERAVGALNGEEFRKGLVSALAGGSGEGERTIGELLDRLLGLDGRDPGDFFVELIFRETPEGSPQDEKAAGGEISETVKAFLGRFLESHREMRIRDFLGMNESTKSDFDRALAHTLIATVDARVPQILETVNVHDLVVSKINGLNIEEVEALLLRVIEKHLRWINIFGAVLGALIGFIQDFLRLVHLSG